MGKTWAVSKLVVHFIPFYSQEKSVLLQFKRTFADKLFITSKQINQVMRNLTKTLCSGSYSSITRYVTHILYNNTDAIFLWTHYFWDQQRFTFLTMPKVASKSSIKNGFFVLIFLCFKMFYLKIWAETVYMKI